MPKNRIGDLRNLMFETIERLMDDDDEGMDVAKAKAVAEVGKVIVDSARVEAHFLKQIGAGSSEFLQNGNGEPKQINNPPLLNGDLEMPDCKCGDEIYPADLEKSERLGLEYPRCKKCLSLLPKSFKTANI